MLNNIEYFRNVILIIGLEFRDIVGVHCHFIHITCCDTRLCLQRGSAKRERMSYHRSIEEGSEFCMSVASRMSIHGLSKNLLSE